MPTVERRHPKRVMLREAEDNDATRRWPRLRPDVTDEATAHVPETLPVVASAVCCDVSLDGSCRPIDETAQRPLTGSEEEQLAFDGAGGCRGLPRGDS